MPTMGSPVVPLAAEESVSFVPLGEERIQNERDMQHRNLSVGTLTATNFDLTLWAHPHDGTTSTLPTLMDTYYGQKPTFVKFNQMRPDQLDEWKRNAGDAVECPVRGCSTPIKVSQNVDEDAMNSLGFAIPDNTEDIRTAVKSHIKAFHKRTFAGMLRSGSITEEEAKYL